MTRGCWRYALSPSRPYDHFSAPPGHRGGDPRVLVNNHHRLIASISTGETSSSLVIGLPGCSAAYCLNQLRHQAPSTHRDAGPDVVGLQLHIIRRERRIAGNSDFVITTGTSTSGRTATFICSFAGN